MSSYCEASPSKTLSSPWKSGIHFFLISSTNSQDLLDEEVPRRCKWSTTDTIITDVLDVPFTKSSSSAVIPNNDAPALYDLVPKSGVKNGTGNERSAEKYTPADPIADENVADASVENMFENIENRVPKMLPRKRQSTVESSSKKSCQTASSTMVRQRSASLSIQCSEEDNEEESKNRIHQGSPRIPCFSCVIGRQSSCLTSRLGQDRSISRALLKLSPEVVPQATLLCPPNRKMEQHYSASKKGRQTIRIPEEEEVSRRASSPQPVEVTSSLVLPLDTCRKRRGPLSTIMTSPAGASSLSSSTAFLPSALPDGVASPRGLTCRPADAQGCFSPEHLSSSFPTLSFPSFSLPRLQCEILASTSLVTIVRRDGRIEAPEENNTCPQKTSSSPVASAPPSSRDKRTTVPTPSSPYSSRSAPDSPFVSFSPFSVSSFLHPSSFGVSDSSVSSRPRWNAGYKTWIEVGDVILVKGVRLELGAFVWIHQKESRGKAEEGKQHKKENGRLRLTAERQEKSHSIITADEALQYCGVQRREHGSDQETVGELPVLSTIPHPLYGIPWMSPTSTSKSTDNAEKLSSTHSSGVLPLLPFFRVEWLEICPWVRQQLLVHYWNAWLDATVVTHSSASAEPLFPLSSSFSCPFTTHDSPKLRYKRKRASCGLSSGSIAPCFSTAVTTRASCRQSSLPLPETSPSASDAFFISPPRTCSRQSNERTDSNPLRIDREREENDESLQNRRNTHILFHSRSKTEEEKNSEEDAATPSSQWPEEEILISSLECPPRPRRLSSCISSSLSSKENEEEEVIKQIITVRNVGDAASTPRKLMGKEKNKLEDRENVDLGTIALSTPPCSTALNIPRYTSFTRRDSSSGRESLIDATSLFRQQLDVLLGGGDSNSHNSTPLRNRPVNSLAVGISRSSTNFGEGDYTQGSQQQQTGLDGGLEYAGKMVQESVDVCYFD